MSRKNRSNVYAFQSERELIKFFSKELEKIELKKIIREFKKNFIRRENTSEEDTRLQFYKKCEIGLKKYLRIKNEENINNRSHRTDSSLFV